MPSTPSLMDTLFQRSLEDLIKGLRLHNPGPPTSIFISKNLEEIKKEIKSTDLNTKSIALQKLTYLHSIHGLNMSNWASFHAIELCSSPFFWHKKIGFLAVKMSFCDTTDVLLLLVNQLRKDLGSPCEFEVSLALETIGIVVNQELAVNLIDNVFILISSSKSFVRKKAIVTLLRVFEVYPDGIKVCFKRLVENLESKDEGCVSASVGVFCELAMRDGRLCLPLAPEFYKVLVECRNNWVLIKVLKVFGKLAELEPRLGKKLVDPVCEHLRRTGAKSVVFECVRVIVSCLSEFEYALRLAVEKIREFLVDDDPNLKYLGLQGLSIVSRKCLWAVVENKDAVIKSLSDADVNIKSEALRLVMAMVSEDNVTEICKVLISYAIKSDPEFCNEILAAILSNCGSNVYGLVIDFDWYVSLLGEMARIQHCQKGEEIENQLIDIGMRVKDVRPELVRVGRDLLIDPALLGNNFIHRILSAAAWLCGEYIQFSKNPFEIMEALLQPRANLLPASVRAVYIHSAFKVLSFCLHSYLLPDETASSWVDSDSGEAYLPSESEIVENSNSSAVRDEQIFEQRDLNPVEGGSSIENGPDTNVAHEQSSSSVPLKKDLFTEQSIKNLLALVETALRPLSGSHEVEIQERVCNVLGLIELMLGELPNSVVQEEEHFEKGESKATDIIKLVYDSFSEDLGPISLSAQERVPIPDGLLLEENLNNLNNICGDIELPVSTSFFLGRPASNEHDSVSLFNNHDKDESELAKESTSLLTEHRKRHGLYYLSSDKKEVVSDYYPPANEPKQGNANDATEDLVKLTEQSFLPKKKPNQVKARPKVVKLEGDGRIPSVIKKTNSTDSAISGAVRDVHLGKDAIPLLQEVIPSDKLSSNMKGKEKLDIGQSFESNEHTTNVDKSEVDTSRSKRNKKHKERKHRSSAKTVEEGDKNGLEDKQKGGHHHTRHKSRHRADADLKVAAQTPVIPDFLL